MYVYFRHDDNKTVMVILSQNNKEMTLETGRFIQNIRGFSRGKNVLNDAAVIDLSKISVPAMSVQVIELMK
jgi:hypothetical protein